MKYQEPTMEIMWLEMETIVRTSLTGEGSGGGNDVGGDGTHPWE